MYCPNCGSSNESEMRFCKRCGTNLAMVSEALTGKVSPAGKIAEKPGTEDRMAKLLRDFYRGRRDTITGAVMMPAGLLIMAILVASGMKPIAAFFIVCWMFFWGASALASGLGKWLASSAELKSLGYGPQSSLRGSSAQQPAPDEQSKLLSPPGYSTGPVGYPGSVTEQTTRQLDERGYAPPPRRE